MKKNLTCVACPLGCSITVELDDNGQILSVTGNTCKRGDAYARTEMTNPTRSLTTTVKVDGDCMKVINQITVKAPVHIGDTIIDDILHTGVAIVATNEC